MVGPVASSFFTFLPKSSARRNTLPVAMSPVPGMLLELAHEEEEKPRLFGS